jgi:hypothetical protein
MSVVNTTVANAMNSEPIGVICSNSDVASSIAHQVIRSPLAKLLIQGVEVDLAHYGAQHLKEVVNSSAIRVTLLVAGALESVISEQGVGISQNPISFRP